MNKVYEYVVLGAGIIGCTIAYELSKRKESTLVMEKNSEVAKGTTNAAGGVFMYNKTIPRSKEWHRIASQGVSHHKRLEMEIGRKIDWNWNGRAELATEPEHLRLIKKKFEADLSDSKNVAWLSPENAEEMFNLKGAFAVANQGKSFEGYINLDEGWIHPIELSHALKEEASKAGVIFNFDCNIEKVASTGNLLEVSLESGQKILAKNVIVALGPNVSSVEFENAKRPEVIPVKGQSLLLKGVKRDFNAVLYANGIWCVQRREGLFVGATSEEGQTAKGNTIRSAQLLNNIIELFPNLADHPLNEVEYFYGFRPKLEGEVPLIQVDPVNKNLYWAVGQHNNGVLMAPFTANKVTKDI